MEIGTVTCCVLIAPGAAFELPLRQWEAVLHKRATTQKTDRPPAVRRSLVPGFGVFAEISFLAMPELMDAVLIADILLRAPIQLPHRSSMVFAGAVLAGVGPSTWP